MRIEKKFLVKQNRCYAAGTITIDGQIHALVATEGEGACYTFSGQDFDERKTVWERPGGTMTFAPIPGTNGEFLSNQKFFRLFQWDEATVVWVRPLPDGTFAVKDLFTLPYIHRFDVLTAPSGKHYFIGCTLATSKETREDWSTPGKIYVAEMPDDLNQPLQLKVLKEGLYQNHGYSRVTWNGQMASLVGAREGAFVVTPPATPDAEWSVEQIMDWPISDLAAVDFDQDGEFEIGTIEQFHGQYFRVYKKQNGQYVQIFQHPEVSEFYHTIVSATLLGKPALIGGCRRDKMQLFCLLPGKDDPLQLENILIDEGVGPSNAAVINEAGRDVIISANRGTEEALMYFVYND